MPAQIDSDKILIKDVFKRWFRVPEYQRPYVWEKEEVADLLDDIAVAQQSSPASQYFLGSIVFQTHDRQDAGGHAYQEHDLLDGQQRLTTCLLLHAVARDLSTNAQLQDACNKAVYQEANAFDGIPERLRIVYDIRAEVRDFVQKYIQPAGGTDDTDALAKEAADADDVSVKHMAAAVLQIREYFEQNPGILSGFLIFFRNNVLLIYVASTELEDAFRLFTVLNNRGMKLRNSDILKTINLRALGESGASPQDLRHNAQEWEEMENELGDEFDTFLAHVRTVLVKEQARKTLLQEFEENVYKPHPPATTPLMRPGKETFQVLKRYRTSFGDLVAGNTPGTSNGYTFSNLVVLLREASRADFWLPPLLYYLDAFGANDPTPFLKRLENKFMAGWVMRDTPSARSEAMNRVLRGMDQIKRDPSLSDAQKRDAVLVLPAFDCDAAEVIRRLNELPVYGQPYAAYVLYKLDLLFGGDNTKLQPPRFLSVEHILPQNPAVSSLWSQDFTPDERQEWTHRLGNLVLIGRRKNTSLGRKDYADKKQVYFQSHIQPFPNTLRALNSTLWTPTALEDNHKNVLATLRQWYQ